MDQQKKPYSYCSDSELMFFKLPVVSERKDYWICEDIIVKITTKSLGDKYYKKKAIIEKVVDKYCAHVKLTDDNTRLKLDQISEGPLTGRVVKGVQYEDISKLAS